MCIKKQKTKNNKTEHNTDFSFPHQFFFFFSFWLYISGAHHLGEIFAFVTVFNPTTEVVTFCLRGWCMLGVSVADIHPYKTWLSQSFEPMQWNACAHRLDLSLYSHLKECWENGVRTYVNSNGKIPSTRKILPRGVSKIQTHDIAWSRTASPIHYQQAIAAPPSPIKTTTTTTTTRHSENKTLTKP